MADGLTEEQLQDFEIWLACGKSAQSPRRFVAVCRALIAEVRRLRELLGAEVCPECGEPARHERFCYDCRRTF